LKKLLCIFFFCLECCLLSQDLRISTIGTNVTEKETIALQHSLRFQNAFFRKQYGDVLDEDIKVIVFGDYSDFYRYANNCCALGRFTTAFFIEQKKEIVVFKNEEFIRSLSHEISHALTVGRGLHKYPWFDEGLAEVLSTYHLDSLGQLNNEVLFLTDSLKIGARTTRGLKRFMNFERKEWDALTPNESYGMAWVLVNYLYQEDRILLTKILDGISRDVSPAETIASNGEKGIKDFVRSLKRHYRRNKYKLVKTRQKL